CEIRNTCRVDGQSDNDFERAPYDRKGKCPQRGFDDELIPQGYFCFFEQVIQYPLDDVDGGYVQKYSEEVGGEDTAAVYFIDPVRTVLYHIRNAFIESTDLYDRADPRQQTEKHQ